jgi:hypothetical protein
VEAVKADVDTDSDPERFDKLPIWILTLNNNFDACAVFGFRVGAPPKRVVL